MSVRSAASALVLCLLLAGTASVKAQSMLPPRPPEPQRITVSVQTSITFPGPTTTPEEQTALQAKARAAFYAIAAAECATISTALNGDCRAGQISVNSRAIEVRPGVTTLTPGVTVSGSMSFTVTPR